MKLLEGKRGAEKRPTEMRLRLRRDCSLSVKVELGFIFFFLAKLYFGLAVIGMVNLGVFYVRYSWKYGAKFEFLGLNQK